MGDVAAIAEEVIVEEAVEAVIGAEEVVIEAEVNGVVLVTENRKNLVSLD